MKIIIGVITTTAAATMRVCTCMPENKNIGFLVVLWDMGVAAAAA